MFSELKPKKVGALLLGSAILSFGLYNIHSLSGVTEGGVLGLTLLLQHWFNISPAVSGFVLNAACYIFGWFVLGKKFVLFSAVAGGGFSIFYAICELFPPIWPEISSYPLLASILGAVFVGVGVGISVRAGGAPGGDDALAMGLAKLTGCSIQTMYLLSDLSVLALSLSYIPLRRIAYSLLTVLLSGQIIGIIANGSLKSEEKQN